jgi:hypothetical protein
MSKAPPVKWTREHYLIALNVYRKLEFRQFDQRNKLIIQVAEKLGRTPSSLAMKLSNLASFDPVQQARGITGLNQTSKQDVIMWAEFQNDINRLGPESEQLLHDLFTNDDGKEVDFLQRDKVRLETSKIVLPTGPTEKEQLVKVRRGQQFFRQTILNAYGVRCAISGINIPHLLVASHIRPWKDFPNDRLNPCNGLCLSSIHDAAFDSGLITIDGEWRVVLSKELKSHCSAPVLEHNFGAFEGKAIRKPGKVAEPAQEFLEHHRNSIFAG